jgi:hypothetical protein
MKPVLLLPLRSLSVALLAGLVLLVGATLPTAPTALGEDDAPLAADAKRFETPKAAVDALLAAVKATDVEALVGLVGQAYRDDLVTGDEGAMKEAREAFLAKAVQAVKLSEKDPTHVEVLLGADEWPFAFPLTRDEKGWAFDGAAGVEELLRRRIGENEIESIAVCREYARVQVEYARVDRDGDEVREFAQRVVSTPGTRDGLWWPATDEADESPLGDFAAAAGDYVAGKRPAGTWHGYYFRILIRQGANPPGGKYEYVINGNMIAGFALVAFPAEYRKTGVMTLVVSHQGKVYEKDLGPDTERIAGEMSEYDPDDTWALVAGDGTK